MTLVYPFFGTGRRSLYFPQGLAYVAASLRNAGHTVTVVDMEGNDLSTDRALAEILKSSPEMVGFGGMITRYKIVRELGRNLRREAPGIFLMAGNSGATTIPGLYLESARMDAVVLGEGEATAVELAGAVSPGRSGGMFRESPSSTARDRLSDLRRGSFTLTWTAFLGRPGTCSPWNAT